MPKKRPAKSSPPSALHPATADDLDLVRALSRREFDSIEDASAFIAGHLGGVTISSRTSETPNERAEAMIEAAWDTSNGKRRIELARKAIALSRDCVDAYVLLAQEAATPEEARARLRDGVEAGARALAGDLETFVKENAMWLAVESRPYLRVRLALAAVCWTMGDRQAAIDEGWELLRLNPGDNQGVRYVLLGWLLSAGSIEQIDRLLSSYQDDGATAWLFGQALHAFRLHGPSSRATALLRAACLANPHVPDFLMGRRELPVERPNYIGWGDESDAVEYVESSLPIWLSAVGSMEWLAAIGRGPAGKAKKRRK